MTIQNTQKLANHICRLLKIMEITFPIARTHKGNLGITFNINNEGYTLMLDAIPLPTESFLDDDNNIELKKMVDKYFFDKEPDVLSHAKTIPIMSDKVTHDLLVKSAKPKKNGKKAKS